MAKTKTVSISSVFPATQDAIWALLTKVETLQYIAASYATFSPVNKDEHMIWQEGTVARFRLRLFGFIPMGVHTIQVDKFDKSSYSVQTIEGNRTVPVWKHKIVLARKDDFSTHYTDEVELGAGCLTGFVYLWSKAFYRHRQRKWIKLLSTTK